jgi:hypothetical protein
MRLVALPALASSLALLGSACGPAAHGPHYEEYQCPAPIGAIVREDCQQAALRYEGVHADARVEVGKFGASGSYQDKAIREADDVIAALKEQRTALCHDFNTCKLSVPEYRQEKQRIESSFTAVVAMKDNVGKMDPNNAMRFMTQLRGIREGKGLVADPPSTPAPEPTPAPTAAPTPTPAPAASEVWNPGKYMLQAVGRVTDNARKLEQNSKYGFAKDHAFLLGAYVEKGKSVDLVVNLKAGREYVLLGGGSEAAIDVDLGVIDAKGKLLAADTADDPQPVVTWKPTVTGQYTIRLALEKSRASGDFVALAVMHEGGYSIPIKNLVASIGKTIKTATAANQKLLAQGRGLVFHEGVGEWSFFGSVLGPEEQTTQSNLAFNTDPTVAIAGADDNGTNIDLVVREQPGGAVVAKDVEPDAQPAVVVHPTAGKKYDVLVQNPTKGGPTMTTLLVLDVKR